MVARPNHTLTTAVSHDNILLCHRKLLPHQTLFATIVGSDLLDLMFKIVGGIIPELHAHHSDGGQSRPHKAALCLASNCLASNANLIIAPAAWLGDVS